MDSEQIRVGAEEVLRRLYPEALIEGSEAGVSEVDFFLEQSVVTTRHGTETTQRRVIAIIAAEWGVIDATAISICEKLQIEPDQLTIMMVAGSQNHSPSPQAQGLRRHGHELRFCLVDDLERTVGSFFYEKDTTERPTAPLNKKANEPKLGLRDLLSAKPAIIGVENSMTVSNQHLQILKLGSEEVVLAEETIKKWNILTWNLQWGREGQSWKVEDIVLIAKKHDVCFFQEVPLRIRQVIIDLLEEDFWSFEQNGDICNESYVMISFIRKNSESDRPWESFDVPLPRTNYVRAMVIKSESGNIALVNIHLPANNKDENRERSRIEFVNSVAEEIGDFKVVWSAGDINCIDLPEQNTPYIEAEIRRLTNDDYSKFIAEKLKIHSYRNYFTATYEYQECGEQKWKQNDFIMGVDKDGRSCSLFAPPSAEKCNLGKHYPVSTGILNRSKYPYLEIRLNDGNNFESKLSFGGRVYGNWMIEDFKILGCDRQLRYLVKATRNSSYYYELTRQGKVCRMRSPNVGGAVGDWSLKW